jgi:hypothetical protein
VGSIDPTQIYVVPPMGVALEDSYQSESQRREVGQLDAGELKKRKEKKNIYIYIYIKRL